MGHKSAAALEMADFMKLSPNKMGSRFKIASVKQSLWTLREAGTKKGRRATGGPLINMREPLSIDMLKSGRVKFKTGPISFC